MVKHCGFSDGKVKKLNNEKCYQEEKGRSFIRENLSKRCEDEEAEHLEKSSLTDEHDEPVCYLSDGTQSSNQRKRQRSPSFTPSITIHKNILRIRLPSLKYRETHSSLLEGQSCPAVGRALDSPVQKAPDKEQCLTSSKVDEASPIAQFDASACNGATFDEKNVPGPESFYKSLIEDWVPPPLHFELNDSNDEDWLFGRKQQSQGLKRLKSSNDMPCQQSSTLWPCAHFLPEADIYALPYSIPF